MANCTAIRRYIKAKSAALVATVGLDRYLCILRFLLEIPGDTILISSKLSKVSPELPTVEMTAHKVPDLMNNPRFGSPSCIAPV